MNSLMTPVYVKASYGTDARERCPKDFWCIDCRMAVELDMHIRCEQCGSDAITVSVLDTRM